MSTDSCLYVGTVYHKRYRPREHRLRYTVFSVLLDLKEIDQLARRLWFFSRNSFNLFGFYDKDFGEDPDEALSRYVMRNLSAAGIHTIPTRTLLSCYPRVLGYVFNPLSLYYCLDENDCCFAVLHEVHNTFGERHVYVLPVVHPQYAVHQETRPVTEGDEKPMSLASETPSSNKRNHLIVQQTEKELFVSPFAHMGMHYQFRLNLPGKKQVVVIRASDSQGLLITASYSAVRRALNNTELMKLFFRIPFMTVKVIAGIHWEAARLWMKGVPLFKHQPKRSN